ncbi:MAG: MMPL family transporter [Magnetovibrio sp.]|nr:MMPL family transporter [Magnetovibrio sp.]
MAADRFTTMYRDALAGWVGWVVGRARGVAAFAALLTVVAAAYFVANIEINTSTTDMLSKELPFRQHAQAIDDAFPQTDNTLVVVIDGQTADIADDAALALGQALRQQSKLFTDVYDLKGEAFFRRNGLLYLGLDELNDLGDRLADAQPFLSTLWRDSSLRGFFGMLGQALDHSRESGADNPLKLAAALDAIADVAEAQAAGRFHLFSWTRLMGGGEDTPADRRRFIVVKPVLDFASLQPASGAIDTVRRLAMELGLTKERGLRVRLTGSAALDEEELASVETGMGLAAVISLVLVLGLLTIGLRSSVLVVANLLTLISGLICTAAFAILAIGALNLISVAFAVLFIGLSVDFGIHFALRYQEAGRQGYPRDAALREAAGAVGGALTLCAVSAAMAFYAFLPTEYVGLAELGLIAGTGMFIAFAANLTLLPALIALAPNAAARPAAPRRAREATPGARVAALVIGRPRTICAAAALFGIAALIVAPRVQFDFDPLNLKDPNTESVATLLDLVRDGSRHQYKIEVLASDLDAATGLAARLDALDLVDKAITICDFVPADQDEKLEIIADLALFVAPSLARWSGTEALGPGDREAAWKALAPKLEQAGNAGDDALRRAAGRVRTSVSALLDGGGAEVGLLTLENRLLTGLPGRLDALNQSLGAAPVRFETLPAALVRRNVAADGRAMVEVYPKNDLSERAELRRFVAAVREVAPNAAGSPVVILEAGRTVLGAFAEACAIAVIGIVILLALVLRRARDVAFVFAPLLLAALWTIAAAAALGVAFNLANVIVLPLLFGLGVAGGIHLVSRARATEGAHETMRTSTPRAVLFSALTTIGSFGSISLSGHPGTASMGVLLTLAITMTLFATLIFLPALLAVVERRGAA